MPKCHRFHHPDSQVLLLKGTRYKDSNRYAPYKVKCLIFLDFVLSELLSRNRRPLNVKRPLPAPYQKYIF